MAHEQLFIDPGDKEINGSFFEFLSRVEEAQLRPRTNIGIVPVLIPASEPEIRRAFKIKGTSSPIGFRIFKQSGTGKPVLIPNKDAQAMFSNLRL
jgi:hypothetical protein